MIRLEEGLGKIVKWGADTREYVAKWAKIARSIEHLLGEIDQVVAAIDLA